LHCFVIAAFWKKRHQKLLRYFSGWFWWTFNRLGLVRLRVLFFRVAWLLFDGNFPFESELSSQISIEQKSAGYACPNKIIL
jgi:hypothetical protein